MAGNNKVFCGYIRKNSLQDIWFNSPILKKMSKIKISEIGSPCTECKIRKLCGGGSRARALSITGMISGLDSWCPIISDKPWRGDVIILQ